MGGYGHKFGHNTVRKHLLVMDLMIVTHRSGKEFVLSFQMLYNCDAVATFGYFFLGLGKLDPVIINKTHPRSTLAFSKALALA
jgi:hypothetical protein